MEMFNWILYVTVLTILYKNTLGTEKVFHDEDGETLDFKCRNISTFDILCKVHTSILVISARPCSAQDVYLTQYINNALKTFNLSDAFELQLNISMSSVRIRMVSNLGFQKLKDYQKNHINLSVAITVNEKEEDFIFNFPVLTRNCFQSSVNISAAQSHLLDNDLYKPDGIHVLGNYSVAFIETNTTSPVKQGLYLVATDFCTVPYTFTVVYYVANKLRIHRYSKTNSDSPISVLDDIKLFIKVRTDRNDPTLYTIELLYKDWKGIKHLLLFKNLFSGVGMMCPLHKCIKNGAYDKTCSVPWVDFDDKEYICSVRVQYHKCTGSQIKGTVNMFLVKDEKLPFRQKLVLTAEKENDMQQGKSSAKMLLGFKGYERQEGVEKDNGYFLLDGGNLTLYASRSEEERIVQISILRHYPNAQTIFPIVRTQFELLKDEKCAEGIKHKRKSYLMILLIAVVMFVLAAILSTVYLNRQRLCFRGREYKKDEGLPYQIHLEEQAEDEY